MGHERPSKFQRLTADCCRTDPKWKTSSGHSWSGLHWADWLYIGTVSAMRRFAGIAHRPLLVASGAQARCYGLCPEEQNVQQLTAQNIRLVPLAYLTPTARGSATPQTNKPDWLRLLRLPCNVRYSGLRHPFRAANRLGGDPCAVSRATGQHGAAAAANCAAAKRNASLL